MYDPTVIVIVTFLAIVGLVLWMVSNVVKESKARPVREREPKPGDRYFSEVFTRTAFGSGRILTIQFHPTLEEANRVVKKNAQWFDDYGNVHPDVGIYWNVGVLTQEILDRMKTA